MHAQQIVSLGRKATEAAVLDPHPDGPVVDVADLPARAAAILTLVGAINLPIIKFSVDWWNTLHQPASLLRSEGPSVTGDILAPLLVMMAAYGLLFAALWVTAIRTEIVRRRVLGLRARRAQEA